MTSSRKDDEAGESTRVDLGDDLIEKTAMLTIPEESRAAPPARRTPRDLPPPPPEHEVSAAPEIEINSVDDGIHSARILMNEGLLEEAKRVLRRVLLMDPKNVLARKRLDEIHDTELRQIFNEGQPRRPRFGHARARASDLSGVNSESVMRALDKDLKLGVFTDSDETEALVSELSLFQDRKAMEDFAEKLDHDFLSADARERIDMGIAFMEMGLYDLAVRQFRAAARDPDEVLVSCTLLADALIHAGRPFEATSVLEPIVLDSEVPRPEKVDCFYLMGRAHERLKRPDAAIQWYQQALAIEPGYRDCAERIRHCEHALAAPGGRSPG